MHAGQNAAQNRNSSMIVSGKKSSGNTSRTNPKKVASPMVKEFVNNGSSKDLHAKARGNVRKAIAEHPAAAEQDA